MTTLRETQRPLKKLYREEPGSSRITLTASTASGDVPTTCSLEVGHRIVEAQAHAGVGGPGTAACSGDLLLGALAACAQVTCQMVAAAMELPVASINVEVTGELDLAGTLGINREVPVGFDAIDMRFTIDAPDVDDEQLASLVEKTEQYCVVLHTLREAPPVSLRAERA
jgi:uncharacterized OsmC-like protein